MTHSNTEDEEPYSLTPNRSAGFLQRLRRRQAAGSTGMLTPVAAPVAALIATFIAAAGTPPALAAAGTMPQSVTGTTTGDDKAKRLSSIAASRPAAQAAALPSSSTQIMATADSSAADAARHVVETYYQLLSDRDFTTAYALWEQQGAASGQSAEAFRDGYAHTASLDVYTRAPDHVEGAAGSLYATVPVLIRATTDDGSQQEFTGSYVLRRSDNVPGASAADNSWHLHSADIEAQHTSAHASTT